MCRLNEILWLAMGITIFLWWACILLSFRRSSQALRCKICLPMNENLKPYNRLSVQARLLTKTRKGSFVHWCWICKYIFAHLCSKHLLHIYLGHIHICLNRSPWLILLSIKLFLVVIYRKEYFYMCLQWSVAPQKNCFRDFPIFWNLLGHPSTRASQV